MTTAINQDPTLTTKALVGHLLTNGWYFEGQRIVQHFHVKPDLMLDKQIIDWLLSERVLEEREDGVYFWDYFENDYRKIAHKWSGILNKMEDFINYAINSLK